MLKKIIINIIIGGGAFFVGALVHDVAKIRYIGEFIALSGIAYGVLNIGFVLFKQGTPLFNKVVSEREKIKAQDNLLKYKKLLDEGILTQDEFDKKSQELKRKIL